MGREGGSGLTGTAESDRSHINSGICLEKTERERKKDPPPTRERTEGVRKRRGGQEK